MRRLRVIEGGRARPAPRRKLQPRGLIVAGCAAIALAVIAVAEGTGSAGASLQTRSQDIVAIDGDTIELRSTGERIRLANIDTPETGDRARCDAERRAARDATREAHRLIGAASEIVIRRTGRLDRYGRTVGFVRLDGRDLGALMIAAGHARPWHGRRKPWCGANR